MGRRLRKGVRISLWTLAGLGVLVLLVLGAALIAVHTDWGRERIRQQIEARLGDAVTGEVSVGRVTGSVLGEFAIEDVVIRSPGAPEGAEAVRIDRIEIDHNPLSLLSRTFHADRMRLEGVHVTGTMGPDGKFDLADLLPPEDPDDTGKPWDVHIRELVLADASFTLRRPDDDPVRVRDLEATMALKVNGGGVVVDLERGSGHWVEEDLTVAAEGWLGKRGPVLTLENVAVTAADSRVSIPQAQLDTDSNTGRGQFELAAPAADLRRLMPETDWLADVALEGEFAHPSAGEPWQVSADGTLAGATVALRAAVRPDAPAIDLSIEATELDPSALLTGAPPGLLTLQASGDLRGESIDTLDGTVAASLSGVVDGREIDQGSLDATLEDGIADLKLDGRGKLGRIRATAKVDFTQSIVVLESDVQVELNDLGQLIPGGEWLEGQATIQAEVTGEVTGDPNQLKARGTATSRRLRFSDFVARDVRIKFDTGGLPGAPSGHVEFAAARLTRDDTVLGPLELVADVSRGGRRITAEFDIGEPQGTYAATGQLLATREGEAYDIELPTLTVRTRDLSWSAPDTHIVYRDDVIEIDRLEATSRAGKVALNGRVVTGGERLGGLLEVAIDSVDLGRVATAVTGEPPPVRGTAELTASLDLARGPVQATGLIRDLRLREDVPPMDVRIELRERQRILDLMVTADAAGAGSAQVHLVTRSPSYLLDLDEWRDIEASEVRSIDVELRAVDGRRLAELLGEPRLAGGRIDADLEAGAGLDPLTAEVRAAELEIRGLRDPVFARIAARTIGDRLALETMVDAQRQGAISAEAELMLPARPLEPASWRQVGLDAVDRLTVTARNLELGELRGLLDDPPEIAGSVDLDLVAREKGQEVEVATSVRGLRLPVLPRPLDGTVTGTLSPDDTELAVIAAIGRDRLLEAELALGAGTRALLRDRDTSAFTRASMAGAVRIPGLPLALIGRQLGSETPFRGELVATAEVTGTLEAPVIELDARAPGAAVDELVFEQFALTGHYEAGDWRAALDARQKDGGTLALTARGDIESAESARANLAARDFRLGFVTPFIRELDLPVAHVSGSLDAQIEASVAGQPQGWLRLRDGRIDPRQNLRPLRDLTLDVSLYRGIAGYQLTAASGQGTLDAAGQMRFQGLSPVGFNSSARVDQLPFVAGATPVSVTANARLEGERNGDLWAIDAVVGDALVRLPDSAGRGELFETGELEDVIFVDELRELEAEGAPPSPTVIRLKVSTPDGVLVRSEDVDALVATDLTVTFIGDDMSIDGNATALRGRVTLFDRRYELITARASFAGEMPPNPRIDVRLAHSFKEATVYIDVGGTLEEPTIEFDSDPPIYDDGQLLGFVLGGRPGAQGDGSLTDKTAGVLTGLVSSQVEGVLRQTFPIDYLRIGTEETQTAYVTVGKWVSDDLFIAYRRNFDAELDENANEAQLEYQLFRSWILEGRIGDRGIGSADLLWTRRF